MLFPEVSLRKARWNATSRKIFGIRDAVCRRQHLHILLRQQGNLWLLFTLFMMFTSLICRWIITKKNIPHTKNNQNKNFLIQVENLKTNTVCDFKTIRNISQSSCRKSTSCRKRFIFLLWSDKKKRKQERCFSVAGKELSTFRADLQSSYVIFKSDP